MREAIEEAYKGIRQGEGGPFGSVIVKDGKIVGRGHNKVLLKKDPTSHGEMEAIRDACKALDTYDLSGCELYTTAAPCPMCMGAILWAGIDRVHYGCTVEDTDAIGFRDLKFYDTFAHMQNGMLHMREEDRDNCKLLFAEYQEISEGKRY